MAANPLESDRNLDALLSEEAGRIGAGISPKARATLEAALAHIPKRSLFEVLAAMPNVGEDSDFAPNRG
jgi:hypothetical protein